jgi:hypothetical protein
MMRVRWELASLAGKSVGSGVTAARLKRMRSIRGKLRKESFSLVSIQDIAGCRAIVKSKTDVHRLVNRYLGDGSRHRVTNHRDLVENPRPGGYRSVHLIMEFVGDESRPHWNKLKVELQIRTQLQHSWATAVEAVGLMRRENLKAGEGDPDWLRLFALMSAEFAVEEDTPIGAGVSPDPNDRKSEIIALTRKLNAIPTLDGYNSAIRMIGTVTDRRDKVVLVQFDYANRTVEVRPFSRLSVGNSFYIREEEDHVDRNTVLVELSKMDELKEAYPNYFLDVTMFTQRLRRYVHKWDPAWEGL